MKNIRIPRYEGDTDNPETMTRTSLVTAVEVRTSKASTIHWY